jgi:lipopolysaccharide/colanic/teichoic acid biosynthesis glycosyltransferase
MNRDILSFISKLLLDIVLTWVAASLAVWLRMNVPLGQLLVEPVQQINLWLYATVIYPLVFLFLSLYDPVRTYKAVDEYQILTVGSVFASLLLGFVTFFVERNTSRLLLAYFYTLQFVMLVTVHGVVRLCMRTIYPDGRPQPTPISGYQRAVKRTLDIVTSSILLVVLTPIMLVIAVAIKLDSRGPILFRQKRVGEGGRIFEMFKFRSMYADAEARQAEVYRFTENGHLLHKHRDDPRVTPVGRILRRTSLDELPQFLNVFMGEMSLVGPRPELPMLVARYEPWQRERLLVPQGLTGWWQINGRSEKPMHLHTEADIYYVRNYSLLLDIRIMFKTFSVVLRGSDAF